MDFPLECAQPIPISSGLSQLSLAFRADFFRLKISGGFSRFLTVYGKAIHFIIQSRPDIKGYCSFCHCHRPQMSTTCLTCVQHSTLDVLNQQTSSVFYCWYSFSGRICELNEMKKSAEQKISFSQHLKTRSGQSGACLKLFTLPKFSEKLCWRTSRTVRTTLASMERTIVLCLSWYE